MNWQGTVESTTLIHSSMPRRNGQLLIERSMKKTSQVWGQLAPGMSYGLLRRSTPVI